MANINRYSLKCAVCVCVWTDDEKYWRLRVTSRDQARYIPFGRIALIAFTSHLFTVLFSTILCSSIITIHTQFASEQNMRRAWAKKPKQKIDNWTVCANQCNRTAAATWQAESQVKNVHIRFNVKAKFPNDLQKERTETQFFFFLLLFIKLHSLHSYRILRRCRLATTAIDKLSDRIAIHFFPVRIFFFCEFIIWRMRNMWDCRLATICDVHGKTISRHRIHFAVYDFMGNSINNKCTK